MSRPLVQQASRHAGDPVRDTLLRPTTLSPVVASAAPVRERGTRSRAGNAMNRTRAALMAGATRAVTVSGTRITMSQVAAASGVAKATLYNHFRTREAVLSALVEDQVQTVVAAQDGKDLPSALADAASLIASSPVRAALERAEPAALATLARIDPAAPGWVAARTAVDGLLAEHGRYGTELVLRWLASLLLNPAGREAIEADVSVLVAGLPVVQAPA